MTDVVETGGRGGWTTGGSRAVEQPPFQGSTPSVTGDTGMAAMADTTPSYMDGICTGLPLMAPLRAVDDGTPPSPLAAPG